MAPGLARRLYTNNPEGIKKELLALSPDKHTAQAAEAIDRLNLRKEMVGNAERGIAMLKDNDTGLAAGFDKTQSGQADIVINSMERELAKLNQLLMKAGRIVKEKKVFEKAAPNESVYGLAEKSCP